MVQPESWVWVNSRFFTEQARENVISFFFRNLLYFMNNNGFHLKINDLLCLGLWLATFQTLSHSPYLQHYEIVILEGGKIACSRSESNQIDANFMLLLLSYKHWLLRAFVQSLVPSKELWTRKYAKSVWRLIFVCLIVKTELSTSHLQRRMLKRCSVLHIASCMELAKM